MYVSVSPSSFLRLRSMRRIGGSAGMSISSGSGSVSVALVLALFTRARTLWCFGAGGMVFLRIGLPCRTA